MIDPFQKIIISVSFAQVRDGRNIVMHSASMTLDQKSFADLAGAMINLLEDSGALSTLKEAQEAARKIREVWSDFSLFIP